ncbi:hypothetical protein FA95DRAFT_1538607 [Auriscalpium vulgare]|uniref:Uncharacterized protein n=1 Tax=Auriscalpium vulgare TaxID=40419 RepID=A0ACB8RYG9_9AGAM|nr:hypothetical protein FA95DRAFT_1538607 [Auriscalpium vulgare]
MATLSRSRTPAVDDQISTLAATVPAPFPSDLLRQASPHLPHVSRDSAQPEDVRRTATPSKRHSHTPTLPSIEQEHVLGEQAIANANVHDVLPSIANVQASVLTTLTDLLSSSKPWQPTLPDRRHSLPARASSSRADTQQPQPTLQALIINLRSRNPDAEMSEAASPTNEAALLHELQGHVDTLSQTLVDEDADLARTLVSLLAHISRLSALGVSPSPSPPPTGTWAGQGTDNVFESLTRQLSDFQIQHQTHGADSESLPPVLAVEKALLWNRIDTHLDTVLQLCRQRRGLCVADTLPQYEARGYEVEGPPGYEHPDALDVKSSSTSTTIGQVSTTAANEKMLLDLDSVTMAIDRLYRVAPQLHNQRVELKSSKLEQLERARLAEDVSGLVDGKLKERELEHIVDMIGKASERKYSDQTVTLNGGMKARMDRARQREQAKRQEFVDKLIEHSDAGRMHSQDASFPSLKPKDPEAMLTLPEFIRESVPKALQSPPDPDAIISLREAALEGQPLDPAVHRPLKRTKSGKSLRSRSMSAPALNWLLPAGSRSGSEARPVKPARISRPSSSSGRKSAGLVPQVLSVAYVAEHHENLRHILAFITVSGTIAGVNLEAAVVPPEGDSLLPSLVVRSGTTESPPLALPVRVSPGAQDVRVQGMHYEVKISAFDAAPAPEPIPLLDATQLLADHPTAFICAMCSLPLVQSARIARYDDLPSEHWEELVDAWMCHSDQKLAAQVARHGQGFWPEVGQALVGGSYILFDASVVVKNNLWPSDQPKHGEEWRTVRCTCGTISGRCLDHVTPDGQKTTVYRLVKYAIRPVSLSAEPLRIPLSAFIVEDMAELARAHATYRFVVVDEEEERPRLLVWLFKPNIRLSYLTQSPYLLPKQGTFQAAKVLYKIIGPSTTYTDLPSLLDRYPGFPQAEQLMYPMDTCTSLAGLLRESNRSYPESMRVMTGLDVGWLLRG